MQTLEPTRGSVGSEGMASCTSPGQAAVDPACFLRAPSSWFSPLPDLRLSPDRFYFPCKHYRPKSLESRKRKLSLVI